MSPAVQVVTDIKPQNSLEKTSNYLKSKDSEGFSDVLEDASGAASGERSTESSYSKDQANTESGGSDYPEDGNDLPSEEQIEHQKNENAEPKNESDSTVADSQEARQATAVLEQINVTQEATANLVAAPAASELTEDVDSLDPGSKIGTRLLTATDSDLKLNLLPDPTTAIELAEDSENPITSIPETVLETRRVANNTLSLAQENPTKPLVSAANVLSPVGDSDGNPLLRNEVGSNILQSGDAAKQSAQLADSQVFSSRASDQIANTAGVKQIDVEAVLKDWVPNAVRENSAVSSTNTNAFSNIAAGLTAAPSASQNTFGLLGGTHTGGQLLTLGTPVSDPAWADDFAVRVRTLVSGNVQLATLNLRPAELGAIEVNLSTEGNETKAQFAVQTAAVREVLEASMPRLREIFEESGLSLADTDVRDQSLSQQNAGEEQSEKQRTDANSLGQSISEQADAGIDTVDTGILRWEGERLVGGVDTFI